MEETTVYINPLIVKNPDGSYTASYPIVKNEEEGISVKPQLIRMSLVAMTEMAEQAIKESEPPEESKEGNENE